MNRPVPAFSDNVLTALKSYDWPGNVRELENLIHRLVVIVDEDKVRTRDLPEAMRFNVNTGGENSLRLKDVVADHIIRILASTSGNKSQAAKILDIDRKTLNTRLKKIGYGD